MTDDKKQAIGSDEHDAALDPMNLLIADALADLVLPPLDDEFDLETAAAALTEEDRRALAALRSPLELVARIVAAAKAKTPPTSEADQSTHAVSSATVSTFLSGPSPALESDPKFDELMSDWHACEHDNVLKWESDYRKKGVIGRGGQGIVFLIVCPNEHNLPRALKVFSPKPYGDALLYCEDMERLGHVASLIYRMQVDNLVTSERFAKDNNGIYEMIMPWINGHDLEQLLRPSLLEQLNGSVDEDRRKHLNDVVVTTAGTQQLRLKAGMAVNIIEKCLRALAALHSHEIIHGDIKPSNIMLDRYGSIRLVDIGSAFELSAPPRRPSLTLRYAAPETLEKGEWSPQSDLASLGYVLIELLCGKPVIASPDIGTDSTRTIDPERDRMLLDAKRRLPERFTELLPADVLRSDCLMTICERLIDPDPKKRFASAQEALEGPDGTYEFLKVLAKMDWTVHYASEIKRWLADVKTALQ